MNHENGIVFRLNLVLFRVNAGSGQGDDACHARGQALNVSRDFYFGIVPREVADNVENRDALKNVAAWAVNHDSQFVFVVGKSRERVADIGA